MSAVERFWLRYTLVWGAGAGVVMLGGFAERWGDLPLMLFAVAMAAPAIIGPIVLGESTLMLSVVAFSLLLNYSQTQFFFDVLHAHYGFHVSWHIRGNPVFLHILTIPYFATYCALIRITPRRWTLPACVALALLETALNATPLTRHLYCFDDLTFALWFGTLAYSIAFVCILPVWRGRLPLTHALIGVCAAVYVDSLMLDGLRFHVAPSLTRVDTGNFGLDRTRPSCLDVP